MIKHHSSKFNLFCIILFSIYISVVYLLNVYQLASSTKFHTDINLFLLTILTWKKLVLYWVQYKNSLKFKVGCFWRFWHVYAINCTQMQMRKSANIFVFTWKQHVENFTLKYVLLFEICAREIWEKIVYKHSETIEHVKN